MEWINVKDKLPKAGFSHCLFYSASLGVYAVGGIHNGVIQSNDEELFHNNITHWMPLPDPPKQP